MFMKKVMLGVSLYPEQETLEETEQERLNKLLEKPQSKPIETPYTEKAL